MCVGVRQPTRHLHASYPFLSLFLCVCVCVRATDGPSHGVAVVPRPPSPPFSRSSPTGHIVGLVSPPPPWSSARGATGGEVGLRCRSLRSPLRFFLLHCFLRCSTSLTLIESPLPSPAPPPPSSHGLLTLPTCLRPSRAHPHPRTSVCVLSSCTRPAMTTVFRLWLQVHPHLRARSCACGRVCACVYVWLFASA